MAGSLPARIENSPPALTEKQERIVNLLSDGMTPAQIAWKLAPHDRKQRSLIRQRVRRTIAKDNVQRALGANYKIEAIGGMGASIQALIRRAATGRPDAIKLLGEMSGFHNTKTQHEHSGEIQITIKGLPRPTTVEDDTVVGEAEVIE